MSLYFTSLNSGSNGNCYYVGNEQEAVLIDIGISCRELEKRLLLNNLNVEKIKAVFISHEHSDHIKGVEQFAKRHKIPIYITQATLHASKLKIDLSLLNSFHVNTIAIGSLNITPFPKYHDAADPYSFSVGYENIKVGIFTDLGRICEPLKAAFKSCDAAFLEANFDDEMLHKSSYPYFLKNRIKGGWGHLSNQEALKLFINYRSEKLQHLTLCHLSKNNNCPELVYKQFSEHAGNIDVFVASREKAGMVHQIVEKRMFDQVELV